VTGGTTSRPTRRIFLRHDRRAVTGIEYAVIAGLMVFVVLTVSSPFATALGNLIDRIANGL
jgi:Flp pilus assembly pilin Flp